jgi:hypothetical protein
VTEPADDPVTQYKEILDTTRQAARKLAERERRRTVELVTEIAAADKAIKAATEAETQVAQEISAWWRQVAAGMAGLAWITPGRPPEPDPAGKPERLEDYLAEIEPATNTLVAALRKASWPRRGN